MLRSLQRRARAIRRRVRTIQAIARALKSRNHPILAQIVATRRCNLSCGYCNEFDKTSAPVPLDEMLARVDRLAALGTSFVDLSGGEPLLHPQLDEIIHRIRRHGMMASLLTNGYLLTPARIERLNRAGLDRLQISIDNVTPDDVSYKSLSVLDQKLRWLAEYATFEVNINSVVGASASRPEDAFVVARRARELGFGTSVGLVHDGSGQVKPLDEAHQRVYRDIAALERGVYSHAHDILFQQNLVAGRTNAWQCRAGSRYLYICEDGLVHWCSQQRGTPAIPLDRYGPDDLRREYSSTKSCAPDCTVSCVHRVALVDELRDAPLDLVRRLRPDERTAAGPPPASVKLLTWMFVTSRQHQLFRRLASRALGVHH